MAQVYVISRVTANLEIEIGVSDCPYIRFGNDSHISDIATSEKSLVHILCLFACVLLRYDHAIERRACATYMVKNNIESYLTNFISEYIIVSPSW